jgi:hypothetical protein
MPTLKQKRAVKYLVENGRASVSEAMVKSGAYTVATARDPGKLTRSKGWQELVEKYLPDRLLVRRHKQLLNARTKDKKIDVTAVSKGLDMGYKLKGSYAPEKKASVNLNIDLTAKNKEAIKIAEEYEKQLRESLKNGSA